MTRLPAAVLCASLLLGAEPEPSAMPIPAPTAAAPAPKPTDPYFILRRAREAFHAHVRPQYIAYNMERIVWLDDQPDGDDGYTLRVWCRTLDAAALTRIWNPFRKRAMYELHFLQYSFRLDSDPGPPTGDIFERAPPTPPPPPRPKATESLRTIAVVANKGDLDYRATFAGIENGAYHLKLQPLRDEERNRLRELWVDAQFEVVRAIEVTHPAEFVEGWAPRPQDISSEGLLAPVRLDMRFEMFQGVPILEEAHELVQVLPSIDSSAHRVEMNFHYDRVVFAPSLPGWYFDPQSYHARFRDSPSF